MEGSFVSTTCIVSGAVNTQGSLVPSIGGPGW